MDGPGHSGCGRLAWNALPDWIRERWQPDLSPAGLARPWLPRDLATPGDKAAELCSIMDRVYEPECRKYATLPDGRWIPHCPPDSQWQAAISSGSPPDPQATVDLIALLLERFVRELRREDWEEAMRYGGALVHFLQEAFTPGHAVDNSLFARLFPDPDPTRHIRLHHPFDAVRPVGPLPPLEVLGRDLYGVAWRLAAEQTRGIRRGMALIEPIVRSVYAGDPLEVRGALLAEQGRAAAWLTGCAWLSGFCLAFDRPELAAVPASLPLYAVPEYFLHAWQYVEVLPGCLVRELHKIPIHVWREVAGRRTEVAVTDGFGMGGHMGIKWHVGAGVHGRFTADIGLPSRHTEGQNEHTDCTFYVDLDDDLNRVYSEDIQYGARTVASCRLEPGAPLWSVDVPLGRARTLILRAVCQPYADPGTGAQAFAVPHVAVCHPRLGLA